MLAEELSKINFKIPEENKKESRAIFTVLLILSLLYTLLALYFLHWLWYHYFISIIGGMVFGYIAKEWFFESERKKLLGETSEFLEAYARCYEGGNGNINQCLHKAMERGTNRIRRLIVEIEEALNNEKYENECLKVKERLSVGYLKSFIDILLVLKEKGRTTRVGEDLFLRAFQQLALSVGQEIIRLEKNELDNKATEVWVLMAPMVAIPGTHFIYLLLFQKYFDVLSSYDSLEAKTTAALTYLLSSLGALFLNWIRKNR